MFKGLDMENWSHWAVVVTGLVCFANGLLNTVKPYKKHPKYNAIALIITSVAPCLTISMGYGANPLENFRFGSGIAGVVVHLICADYTFKKLNDYNFIRVAVVYMITMILVAEHLLKNRQVVMDWILTGISGISTVGIPAVAYWKGMWMPAIWGLIMASVSGIHLGLSILHSTQNKLLVFKSFVLVAIGIFALLSLFYWIYLQKEMFITELRKNIVASTGGVTSAAAQSGGAHSEIEMLPTNTQSGGADDGAGGGSVVLTIHDEGDLKAETKRSKRWIGKLKARLVMKQKKDIGVAPADGATSGVQEVSTNAQPGRADSEIGDVPTPPPTNGAASVVQEALTDASAGEDSEIKLEHTLPITDSALSGVEMGQIDAPGGVDSGVQVASMTMTGARGGDERSSGLRMGKWSWKSAKAIWKPKKDS